MKIVTAKYCKVILTILMINFCLSFLLAASSPRFPVRGKNGMVVTSEKLASQVGIEILKKGGNAVDAAVAVGFALSVTYPTAGNLGGGGFMVIRFPNGRGTTIDFREKAPLKATRDMYLDEQGNGIEGKSTFGYLACGVPGSVAGLIMALEKYGTMKLSDVIKAALKLAKKGFPVSYQFHNDLVRLKDSFNKFPSSAKIFLKQNDAVYAEGEIFKQADLYKTLKLISKQGVDAFYSGKIAQLIVSDIKRNGGIICLDDLKRYKTIERTPVKGSYREYEIISMGPPSSGGIALIQSLNILEQFNLAHLGLNSSRYIHVLTETLRNVFAVRAQYLGDADFVNVPQTSLLSKSFANNLMNNINLDKATPSDSLKIANPFHFEGNHTTHYNVIDKNGLAVAVTTTINSGYGAKAVVEGAGFLLNNEMDDFATKTGSPNIYGLIAFKPNEIEPEKKMLSSMSPTIITKNGKFFMAIGAMGGPQIITSTLQTIINVIDFGMSIQEAIDAPRIHHQWQPDKIFYERIRLPDDVINNLSVLGHYLDKMDFSAEVMAICYDSEENVFLGAADFRWHGEAVGY